MTGSSLLVTSLLTMAGLAESSPVTFNEPEMETEEAQTRPRLSRKEHRALQRKRKLERQNRKRSRQR